MANRKHIHVHSLDRQLTDDLAAAAWASFLHTLANAERTSPTALLQAFGIFADGIGQLDYLMAAAATVDTDHEWSASMVLLDGATYELDPTSPLRRRLARSLPPGPRVP